MFTLNENKQIADLKETSSSEEISRFINQYIYKIEKICHHYNVIIANIYEAYSFLAKIVKEEKNYSNLVEDYSKFLISISPVIPHFSHECLSQMNKHKDIWPEIQEKFLVEENVNIVVQFNGKKRGVFETKKDTSEKELVEQIMKSKVFDKNFNDKKIKKQFYVNNRLINFIV